MLRFTYQNVFSILLVNNLFIIDINLLFYSIHSYIFSCFLLVNNIFIININLLCYYINSYTFSVDLSSSVPDE